MGENLNIMKEAEHQEGGESGQQEEEYGVDSTITRSARVVLIGTGDTLRWESENWEEGGNKDTRRREAGH